MYRIKSKMPKLLWNGMPNTKFIDYTLIDFKKKDKKLVLNSKNTNKYDWQSNNECTSKSWSRKHMINKN